MKAGSVLPRDAGKVSVMTEATIVCPNCGAAVTNEATVCPGCGQNLAALAHLEYRHAMLYNEGLALAREGKLDEAAAKLLATLESRESYAPAHVLLAKVYARQGEWTRAQAAASRARDLMPGDAAAYELLRDIEAAAGEAEEARRRELQAAAARVDPNSAVHQLAVYQRDIKLAFGVGVGVAAFIGLLIGWIRGGRHHED